MHVFLGVKALKFTKNSTCTSPVSLCITISLLSNPSPLYLKSLKLMNSKGRSSAAWWAEPQPVETGLSVDDRPNELNIAFWVISSVGAASPLLLHIIYVSVRAPSLSSPLYLSFFHFTPPHTNTSLSLSLALCVAYSLFSLSPFHPFTASFFTLHLSSLQFCPLVSLFLISSLSFLFSFFFYSCSLSLCISLLPLSLSPSPLLFSLSLPPFVSFPPSLSSSLFFFCLTLSVPFFLSSYLSLWASLSLPSLSFSLPLSLPLISEPCLWSSIALC